MATDPITASPDGTYTALADGRYTIRFERRIAHPIERLWAAITEPNEILAWLGEAEVDLVEGGRMVVRWLNDFSAEQAAQYGVKGMEGGNSGSVMNATIVRLDPPRLLELDTDAFGRMRFELFGESGSCLLRFSSTFETPVAMLAQTLAGWHVHLDHLERVPAGERAAWESWADEQLDRWAEIRDRYAARIAATE